MKVQYREFDLEALKSGGEVMTRRGNDVRVLCHDAAGEGGDEYIVALVKDLATGVEYPAEYSLEGKRNGDPEDDLVMRLQQRHGFVNIYDDGGRRLTGPTVFSTEDEAYYGRKMDGTYIDTCPVTWEE